MRKILILALTIFAIGGAYALTAGLFPDDDTRFPRVPATLGTIGGAISDILGVADLANYLRDGGDGTVENSEKLGGITADNYLKHNTCTTPGDVWIGVGTDGTPLCGPVGSLYATEIGTLNGVVGTVTITKHDGSPHPGVNGDTLYYGDTLSTASASSGSITFSDASIVRLGELTSVELSTGENPDGQTVAEIILADGSLWSRVISTDGINIGGGGYIAGVRGTSLSVVKSGPNYTFSVVDSTTTDTSAVELKYGTTTKANLARGSTVTVPADTNTAVTPTTPGKNTLLATDWIGTNTVLDMEYMLDLKEENTLSPTLQTKLDNEFDVTVPSLEDTSMCSAIEGTDSYMDCSSDASATNIPDVLNTAVAGIPNPDATNTKFINDARKELKALNILCRQKYNGVFWPTIGKCVKNNPNGNIIFAADFTNEFFSDPNQFVPMPIASTMLSNLVAQTSPGADGVTGADRVTTPALIGRTITIAPMLEKYLGTTINDDGNFMKSSVSIESDFYPPENGSLWRVSTMGKPEKCGTTRNCSYFLSQYNTGWDSFFIPNAGKGRQTESNGGWNTWSYPSGIWIQKNIPTTISGPEGVLINTVGQYIAYPLSMFPGGLNGKYIKIEINDDAAISTNILIDLGGTNRISKVTKSITYPSGYKCGWTPNNCVTKNGNTLSFQIPIGITMSYFVIGNNYDNIMNAGNIISSQLSKPIGATFKRIEIVN